jgi:EpsI family protein
MTAAFARSVLVLAVLVSASIAAARMTPRLELGASTPALAALIPDRFGEWVAEPESVAPVLLVPDALTDADEAQVAAYDDVLMRTYRRADGARVMVALAYGRRQTQEIKIHRPELCYYAQGFVVKSLGIWPVRLSDAHVVESHALLTQNRSRTEVVTYWIRVGEQLALNPWDLRWTIFRDGLAGRVPDGLLVRASSLAESPESAERELHLQHAFLADLYRAVPAATRQFVASHAEALP